MKTTVEWFASLGDSDHYSLALQSPKPFIPYLVQQYGKSQYFACPAMTDRFKNTYLILSPFDFTLEKNKDGSWHSNNAFVDVNQYKDEPLNKGYNIINSPLNYYFMTKTKNVLMELIQPPFVDLPYFQMEGEFNINKIVRPSNYTFIPHKNVDKITIKRNDPIMAVRFRTSNKVILNQIESFDRIEKIRKASWQIIYFKNVTRKTSLKTLYKLFEKNMKQLWKNS